MMDTFDCEFNNKYKHKRKTLMYKHARLELKFSKKLMFFKI